jgi:hypothetical protein
MRAAALVLRRNPQRRRRWCVLLSLLPRTLLHSHGPVPTASNLPPVVQLARGCSHLFFRTHARAGHANPRVAGLIDGDSSEAAAALRDATAVAAVDGCNAQGAVVGKFCMDLAVQKAKRHGVGIVVARNSNHYGIAGFYTEAIAREHGAYVFACVRAACVRACVCSVCSSGKTKLAFVVFLGSANLAAGYTPAIVLCLPQDSSGCR